MEYVVGEQQVSIFLVRRDGIFTASVPITRRTLTSRVDLMRGLLARAGTDDWVSPAFALSQVLLAPLQRNARLRGVKRLYVVPHGVLNYVPFAALPDRRGASRKLLVDRFVVSVLPAASLLSVEQPALQSSGLLAMAPARSHLRYAQQEAASVAATMKQATHAYGGLATETLFKRTAANYSFLHLATHGRLNRYTPLLSELELQPDAENDGRLQVYEVLGLDLHARLVTLSACETALGSGYFTDIPAGDEFVSLTRAFLAAGSRAVVASLWAVDDRSTSELMGDFYRNLGSSGPAEALARAQRGMRHSSRYGHPFFWAAFVVSGND